jgi:hypothetical protein
VYPGSIPGTLPVGLRYNTYYQQVSANRNNFNQVLPAGHGWQLSFPNPIFSLDTSASSRLAISAPAFRGGWMTTSALPGANANGALGDGYLKFNDLSRFLKLPKDSLNLRAGQFELDLPFSQARTWNLSGWDIFSEANVGIQNGLGPAQNVNNGSPRWKMRPTVSNSAAATITRAITIRCSV